MERLFKAYVILLHVNFQSDSENAEDCHYIESAGISYHFKKCDGAFSKTEMASSNRFSYAFSSSLS